MQMVRKYHGENILENGIVLQHKVEHDILDKYETGYYIEVFKEIY